MLSYLFAFAGVVSAISAASPAGVVLNANAKWYQDAKPPETTIEGTVTRTPTTGRVGPPTRFNVFQLSWTDSTGQSVIREIHAPEKAHLLGDYLDRRVRLVGKLVDTEIDGKTYYEFWPARLVTEKSPAKLQARNGVLARTNWRPQAGLQTGKQTAVFRDGAALARFMRVTGDDAGRAAAGLMAKHLNVQAIDWDKQMLVHVCAGLKTTEADRLSIVCVVVKDKALIVTYRLSSPEGGATGFGYPAETALVERFDGSDVRFEEEKDAGK
jgi:hypothetical protein